MQSPRTYTAIILARVTCLSEPRSLKTAGEILQFDYGSFAESTFLHYDTAQGGTASASGRHDCPLHAARDSSATWDQQQPRRRGEAVPVRRLRRLPAVV